MHADLLDPVRRNVAMRLTLASLLAMAVATALSLENPWWAAMAVWMVGQPPRGVLVERAMAQIVGAAIGCCIGATLGLAVAARPGLALAGLTA